MYYYQLILHLSNVKCETIQNYIILIQLLIQKNLLYILLIKSYK